VLPAQILPNSIIGRDRDRDRDRERTLSSNYKRKDKKPTQNKNKTKNADSHEGRGCRKRRYGDHWAYIAAATTDFNLKFLSPVS
jgi:hypothetical protein